MVRVPSPPEDATTQPSAPQVVAQPEDDSQVSVELVHVTAAPLHTPAVQTSDVVQASLSLHEVPSGALTMAGHLGGPPPCSQVSETRTWQGPARAHTSLWQVSGPARAASATLASPR
jgi:hypothetical protein